MNNTTEAYTTWLYQVFLEIIDINNGVVEQKNQLKYIDAKIHSELDNTSTHVAWYGKGPVFPNYRHLDVTSMQLHHHIKSFMNEHKKCHSWVILTVEKQ